MRKTTLKRALETFHLPLLTKQKKETSYAEMFTLQCCYVFRMIISLEDILSSVIYSTFQEHFYFRAERTNSVTFITMYVLHSQLEWN